MKKITSLVVVVFLLTGCLATKVPVVTQNTDGTLSTNLVYQASPVVGQISSGVAAVSPLIPSPFGQILTIAAGLLGTGVAAYVAHRNKKNANNWQGVATTIIEGVESLGPTAAEVKKVIAETAVKNGTADAVHAAVQDTV